jgi:hypothetical protein
MDPTSNERPPPREKRARKEEAESNSLRQPTDVRQQVSTARLWIGTEWIVLVVGIAQADESGVCTHYEQRVERARDVDEAAALCRAVLRHCPIQVRITPRGRLHDGAADIALGLAKRGGITLPTIAYDETDARRYAHEIRWADNSWGLPHEWARRPLGPMLP